MAREWALRCRDCGQELWQMARTLTGDVATYMHARPNDKPWQRSKHAPVAALLDQQKEQGNG